MLEKFSLQIHQPVNASRKTIVTIVNIVNIVKNIKNVKIVKTFIIVLTVKSGNNWKLQKLHLARIYCIQFLVFFQFRQH